MVLSETNATGETQYNEIALKNHCNSLRSKRLKKSRVEMEQELSTLNKTISFFNGGIPHTTTGVI